MFALNDLFFFNVFDQATRRDLLDNSQEIYEEKSM